MIYFNHSNHHRRQKVLRSALAVAVLSGAGLFVPSSATTASAIDAPGGVFFYEPFDNVPIGDQDDASVVLNGNLALAWGESTFEGTVDENGEFDTFETGAKLHGAATLELAASTAGDFDEVVEVLSLPMASFPVGPLTVTPYVGANLRFSGHAEGGARASVVAPFSIGANFASSDPSSASGSQRFLPEVGLPDLAGVGFDVSVTVELSVTFMISVNDIPVGGPTLTASMGVILVVDTQSEAWWDLDGIGVLRGGWARPDVDGSPVPPRLDRMLVLSRLARTDIAAATTSLPDAVSSTRWAQIYDDVSIDKVGAVVPADEELVVHGSGSYPWLATLDSFGNPIRQQRGPLTGFDLARTASGALVSVGDAGGGGANLERYAFDGSQVWSRAFAIGDAYNGHWSELVAIGEDVVAVGTVIDPDDFVARLAVIRVDAGGNEMWTTKLDLGPGTTVVTADGIAVTANGDLLIVATGESDADPSLGQTDAFIMRLNPDGDIVRANVLGGALAEDVMDIAVQPNGAYAISGWTTVDHNLGAWIASFDADDTLRWSATYADGLDPMGNFGELAGITSIDGGYVVAGKSAVTHDNGWVIRIDLDGMPVWSKTYVGDGHDEFVGVVALPTGDRLTPGGVVAYGTTYTGTISTGMWLVRTNVDGMVASLPDSGFTTVNGRARWTPSGAHTLFPLTPTEIPTTVQDSDSYIGTMPAAVVNTQVGG